MSSPLQESITLMMNFAERTGLTSELHPQRYLWTDAFAVCNFLGLAQVTGDRQYLALALRLVDQVHHTLGRHRDDDSRRGWISGLSEHEGEAHPTRGGLRIGKGLPERGPNTPLDERLEWERDGQYFHYLTKWMHALDQVARMTGEAQFNRWARELAKTAYNAFTYLPSTASRRRHMYWKMSIDLSRPQVPSMGQHDPLDGYITAVQLQSTAALWPQLEKEPILKDDIRQFAAMLDEGDWATGDALGLGGLLMDAYRAAQLMQQGARLQEGLLEELLAASQAGIQYYVSSGELRRPAEHRLAFRELGLAIGLRALGNLGELDGGARFQSLMQLVSAGDVIETFWRLPDHRRASTWFDHRDINDVMLATRLVPDGMLVLLSKPAVGPS